MKLLLDENLSDRIAAKLTDLFPGSAHVKTESLIQAEDSRIWEFAKENGFTIVSKDADAAILILPPTTASAPG